jgi:heterodisulfide reductase subunit A
VHRANGADALAAAGFDADTALGIAVPVAAFSTYPAAWRFIDSLPEGNGREAFFLATMGGTGFGMHGPIGRTLRRKGYTPVGARFIRMCANYGDAIPRSDALAAVLAAAKSKADAFADRLVAGKTRWGCGWFNILAPLFAWTAKTGRSFKTFRRVLPLSVDAEKCTGCGLCVRQCPQRAVRMAEKGKAVLDAKACQSCQRCAGYCPANAIGVRGKEARQHRAVTPEAMAGFLGANTTTK